MFQIDNHEELALNDVIPYLLQFPQLYNLIKQSGLRYQDVEDIAWKLLRSLDYETAHGVWLDYIGRKVGQSRIYTPVPEDAFTFGGTNKEGFGAGKFKGYSSTRSTKVARTDATFKNAIKAKIIQNNTDTSLDELSKACKFLFNASLVKIEESYPANIKQIELYGSNVLKTLDARAIIKNTLPAGVSIENIVFKKFYNLFRDNAFITYNDIIPVNDNFELSVTITPDILEPHKKIALFSQNRTFASEYSSILCYYNSDEGIVFKTSPNKYQDNDLGTTNYNDGLKKDYVDSDGDVVLNGGELVKNENNTLKITKADNTWSMFLNGKLLDTEISNKQIAITPDTKFYLGTSENEYYNSGSMYSLYLKNNTTGQLIINDNLKSNTIGINNGVKFI